MARTLGALAGACLLAAPACAEVAQGPKNAPELEPAFSGQSRAPEAASGVGLAVEPLAEGLEHPWGMALLPDGAIVVTERPGRMRVVLPDGRVTEPVAGVPEVGPVDVVVDGGGEPVAGAVAAFFAAAGEPAALPGYGGAAPFLVCRGPVGGEVARCCADVTTRRGEPLAWAVIHGGTGHAAQTLRYLVPYLRSRL